MRVLRTDAKLGWVSSLLLGLLPFVLIAGVYMWKSAQLSDSPKANLVPSPAKIVQAFREVALPLPAPEVESDARKAARLDRQFVMWKDTWASGKRLGIAFGIILLAVPVGLWMGSYPVMQKLGLPFQVFAGNVPAMALLGLLFLFLGTEEAPKIAIVVLGVFTRVSIDTFQRARAIPREMFYKAQSLGMSEWEIPWRLVYPQVWPEVLNTIRLNVGLGVALLLSAEWSSAQVGFGFRVLSLFQKNAAVAHTIVYCLYMMALMFVIDITIQRWIRWRYRWFKA